MDNLKLLKVRTLPIDIEGDVVHVTFGEDDLGAEIFYLVNDTLVYQDLAKGTKRTLCQNISNVISSEHLTSYNKIALTTPSNIIFVDCVSKEHIIKAFENPVVQVGWNSTHDALAVVFKTSTLKTFALNSTCDLIQQGETYLSILMPRMQNVGWGSDSNQFTGPVRNKDEVEDPEPHMQPVDYGKPLISWRANSDEFIVSFIYANEREFKVFDIHCAPKAQSKGLLGLLYGPVAWKPLGNVIAAAIYHNHKSYIGLFERNGLFRMFFPLVDIFYPITFLSWSKCGKVLTVIQENRQSSHVCLYVTSNFKWYLKQHLKFPKTNNLYSLKWLPTSEHCIELMVVSTNYVLRYKFTFDFSVNHTNSLVASVDGRKLNLHAIGLALDPAPMHSDQVSVLHPINMIAFHPAENLVALFDSANILHCYSFNGTVFESRAKTHLKSEYPLQVNHLFWKGNNPFFLSDSSTGTTTCLFEYDLTSDRLIFHNTFDVTLHAIEHVYSIKNVIAVHDEKTRTFYNLTEDRQVTSDLPYAFKVIPLMYENDIYSILLTPEHDLFLNSDLICKNVTSVIFNNNYLVLTNNSCLYSTKLDKYSVEALATHGITEFHERALNELCYLICMICNTPNTLLHTPRGNLEVIPCRPMEMEIVEAMLSKSKWGDAIKFVRLSRLNWNILIDLNADRFYRNLPIIVENCKSQLVLSAIISEINDESCFTTLYKNAIPLVPYIPLDKRKNLLNAILEYLEESGKHLNNMPVVVKICTAERNLMRAIKFLSSLMKAEAISRADESVTLLLNTFSCKEIFDAAVQVVDLRLAGLVARKCHMNPLEVGPIMAKIAKDAGLDQKLIVHLEFHQWDKAILYLLRKENSNKDEILEFISEHDVSKISYLECVKLDLPFKEDVANLFIQKLISEKKYDEAALLSVQYDLFDQAVLQYKQSLNYKKCIEYLPLTSFDDEQKRQLLIELAEKLVGGNKFVEAAYIYQNELNDVDKAVEVLMKGSLFAEALFVCRKLHGEYLIDTDILPQICVNLKNMMDDIGKSQEMFLKLVDRLKKLRHHKKFKYERLKKQFVNRGLGTPSNDDLESTHSGSTAVDLENSDIQSVISDSSRRSFRSSSSACTVVSKKQERKLERMKQDLTEGSKFEDIAIMRELHGLITKIFNCGPEFKELAIAMLEYSLGQEYCIKAAQEKLLELQLLIMNEVQHIWHEEFNGDSDATYISENFYAIDAKYRDKPPEMATVGISWVLESLKD